METNILKRIFFDENEHWDRFVKKYSNRLRKHVIKEIEKFRTCGTYEKGYKLFVCEGCNNIKKIPFRCKGRFCTSCACGETEEWSRLLEEDVFKVNHRHIIFTIDEGLRDVFLKHRHLLKEFVDESVRIVNEYFKENRKTTPGIIAGLHTFGSKLDFNPHVHMLVTMGGMKINGEWKSYDFIPFDLLRKRWQTTVLKLIRKRLSPSEKSIVQSRLQKAYSSNANGFYVYAPKQKGNVKFQVAYIGRYMKRPAIGLKRIVRYDGKTVTFKYKDKYDGLEKEVNLTVEEFISCIIRHIPDANFKTIRYYGIYSRRIKSLCRKLVTLWQKTVRRWIVNVKRKRFRKSWRRRLIDTFNKDPLICNRCNNYFEYKGEVYEENGQLRIKVALCIQTKRYLEREIHNASFQKT